MLEWWQHWSRNSGGGPPKGHPGHGGAKSSVAPATCPPMQTTHLAPWRLGTIGEWADNQRANAAATTTGACYSGLSYAHQNRQHHRSKAVKMQCLSCRSHSNRKCVLSPGRSRSSAPTQGVSGLMSTQSNSHYTGGLPATPEWCACPAGADCGTVP